jgi:hypothetical protein
MEPLLFLDTDVGGPPAQGWHAGFVTAASWRQSTRHNRMVHLVLVLDGVSAPFDRIADYFVLEGATPRGIACSRRRLVELFRACGLSPSAGDEIRPDDLLNRRIEVKIVHEVWKGSTRLQVVAYRPARPLPAKRSRETDVVTVLSMEHLERHSA